MAGYKSAIYFSAYCSEMNSTCRSVMLMFSQSYVFEILVPILTPT